jgi:hypothetical protein
VGFKEDDMWRLKRQLALILAIVACTSVVDAQRQTIPDAIARGSVAIVGTWPSGPVPTLRDVARASDVIVTGSVVGASGHLSADQADVYTDYSLRDVTVLYEKGPRRSLPEHPLAMTITMLGGTVVINGVPFTHTQTALPPLEPGMRVMLFLQRVDDALAITGNFFGVFDIGSGALEPKLPRTDFVPEYRGRLVDEVVGAILRMVTDRQ